MSNNLRRSSRERNAALPPDVATQPLTERQSQGGTRATTSRGRGRGAGHNNFLTGPRSMPETSSHSTDSEAEDLQSTPEPDGQHGQQDLDGASGESSPNLQIQRD